MSLHVYNFNTTYDPPAFFPRLFYTQPTNLLEVYNISTPPTPVIPYFPKPPSPTKPKLFIPSHNFHNL